jgi:hypothetical protein
MGAITGFITAERGTRCCEMIRDGTRMGRAARRHHVPVSVLVSVSQPPDEPEVVLSRQ